MKTTFTILITFIISAVVVNFLLADRILNSLRKEESLHRLELAAQYKDYQSLPAGKFKSQMYSGKLNDSFLEMGCSAAKFPESKVGSALESKLAYPWPEYYITKYNQKFNPRTFTENAFSFFCHSDTQTPEWRREFVDQLLTRLNEYSEADGQALYVVYKFIFRPLDFELKPGWRSAFAQSQILTGLVLLSRKSDDPRILKLLHSFFKSYSEKSETYEVKFYDSRGYLWFDEYPMPGTQPSSFVLNGHIWGLMGVYHYWALTKDKLAEKMLREGITTVKDHAMFYRYKGRVNCYDLRTCEKDYEFRRAFNQMQWLAAITNDSAFEIAHYLFKRDFEIMTKYQGRLAACKKNFFSKIKCSWTLLPLLGEH